ncbi:MAG: nucleotidyltransferase family protein, partial [Gemmatimonadaceae bacterium]
MTASDALKRHRGDVLRLAAQYGATDVRVFGSVARGDAGESSDIDLLVRMTPGRSVFDIGGLLMDLQELLGRRVDVVTERGLRPRIRERVLREAKPIYTHPFRVAFPI